MPLTDERGTHSSVFASLALAASFVAHAEEPDVISPGMQWIAPPGCPTDNQVQGWLRELTVFDGSGITARAHAGQTALWVVDISVESGASEGPTRSISGESCEAVARAAVVAVALSGANSPPPADEALKPAVDSRDAAVPPSNEVVEVAAAPPEQGDSHPPYRSRPPQVRMRLLAAGLLGYGALPKLAGGVYVGGGLQGRIWWLDVGAQHWFRSFAAASLRGAGISIALTTANVGVGPRFTWGPVELRLGVVGQGGRARAVSIGAAQPKTTRPVWWALGGRLGLHWFPASWVSLGGRATAVAPLVRNRYVLGGETLHQPTVVGFESALVLTFVLGSKISSAAPRARISPWKFAPIEGLKLAPSRGSQPRRRLGCAPESAAT